MDCKKKICAWKNKKFNYVKYLLVPHPAKNKSDLGEF